MSRFDVVALGELLIDFTNNADSEQGNPMFEANPGGAPCNVLSMLGNLGNKVIYRHIFIIPVDKQLEYNSHNRSCNPV